MRLLIVDDDTLVRESLSIILAGDRDLVVAGTAADGYQALKFMHTQAVDIVLMDIQMPVMDGIAATKSIRQEFPQVKVIMLTTFHDFASIQRSLQAGASGYLLKSDETAKQILTIKSVFKGLPVISEEALRSLTDPATLPQLTQRENEILVHVANGLSNKEIAERQFVTEGTVRNTISTILEKLGLRDRTQLAIHYWRSKSGS